MKSIIQFIQDEKFDVLASIKPASNVHVGMILNVVVALSIAKATPVAWASTANRIDIGFEKHICEEHSGVKGGVHLAGIITANKGGKFEVIARKNGVYQQIAAGEGSPAFPALAEIFDNFYHVMMAAETAEIAEEEAETKPDAAELDAIQSLLASLGIEVHVIKLEL